MWSAWGQPKAKEIMTGFSNTFLLISIFIRPSLCEDSVKKDLIIAVISVFMLISALLVLGCCFIHYKLMTSTMTLVKETKSFAIQTRHVEKMVLLTRSQATPLTASPQQPLQLTAAPTPSPHSTPPPKHISSQLSISHIYNSYSSESFHSVEQGSIYSVAHVSLSEGSPLSSSRESLDSKGSEAEDEGESSESESFILCAIHQI